ncbi:MAG TPA: cysteine desulfurase [Rectinemataceae bacterium]|nr:cysteine desulfurase [Rectinemataceae bacterium]
MSAFPTVVPAEPDIVTLRSEFPILSREINGHPLAYLDNAATSQKPRSVIEAVDAFYTSHNANIHRSLHSLGEEATADWEGARKKVARFIGAATTEEIVFTRGTTESINLVASSWGDAFLREGDLILLTLMEHHSNIVPWQLAAARRGARLAYIAIEEDGSLDLEAVERGWDPRTRIVCATHMSNVLGTINDLRRLADIAHSHGALLLADAAQSVPHMGIDVGALGCDFLAFSGHKMYAPMGIGVLWGREALLEAMPPYMGGGDMIRSVGLESSTWNELPWKFEAGTPDVGGAVGLSAAIDFIETIGWDYIGRRESALGRLALETLEAVPGLRVHGRAQGRGAVFSFSFEDIHPHDIAQFLDREGIAVRAGHHCAQPLMRHLGVPATARASLAFWNEEAEVRRLGEALEGARRFYL